MVSSRVVSSSSGVRQIPPAGNGVHHGGDLQRGCQQLPLPKAEIGVGPAGRKSLLFRQDPRRRVQGIGERDRLPEAQLLCHGADGISPPAPAPAG